MIFLFLLMIIAGFMEMCSVSLIVPFMDMVMKPETTMNKWYIIKICDIFEIKTASAFLIMLALGLAALYLVKNFFIVCEVYIQQRVVGNAMFLTQSKCLYSLIYRSYEDFMDVSSDRILTMTGELIPMVFTLLTQLLNMFSELVTSAMLIIALFIITPKVSLIMTLGLTIVLFCISRLIKPALRRAALSAKRARSGMNKWQMQAVQGIKELKIMNTEDYFMMNFNNSGKQYVGSQRKQVVWNNIPRALIETSTMCGFLIMVAIHIANGNKIGNMFPIIAAIAMAAVRLLPAANRISTAMASISYSEPYLDEVIEFINGQEPKDNVLFDCDARPFEFDNEIRMETIVYKYPHNDAYVLKDASIRIKKGESVGIVGTSGAGKTTAVDIILGLLTPETGRVTIDGVDIRDNMAGWLSKLGYIPQTIFMLDDTIRRNVAFGISDDDIDDNMVWKALDDAALGDFVRGLSQGLDSQIGERGMRVSGGQRQRIGIARALYRNPDILFFDEATAALDNETEETIMESINSLKGRKTMIIVAHRLTTIELCEHVYRVENGKIIKER